MGCFGSTRWNSISTRDTVESNRSLDINRLNRAGFVVDRVLGDYRGRPWDDRADVWIILAKKR